MNGRRRTLLFSLTAVAFMAGMVAASVPLYRIFCEVTGYGGTPRVVASDTAQTGQTRMTIRFDANVMPDLPWHFQPEAASMTVKVGETNLAVFKAENVSKEPIVGQAVFNVTPAKAALYVDKIQCFCFTEQRLAAGEKADMPVSFYIDPKILNDKDTFDVRTITLSYTFYKSRDQSSGAVGADTRTGKEGKS